MELKQPTLRCRTSFSAPCCLATLALVALSGALSIANAAMLWQSNPLTETQAAKSASQFSLADHTLALPATETAAPGPQISYSNAQAEDSLTVLSGLNLQKNTSAGAVQVDLTSVLDQFDDSGMEQAQSAPTVSSVDLSRSHLIATPDSLPATSFALAPETRSAPASNAQPLPAANTAERHVHSITYAADIRAVPEMSAFFPIIGLLTAIASTHFLRRRRLAQQLARSRAAF